MEFPANGESYRQYMVSYSRIDGCCSNWSYMDLLAYELLVYDSVWMDCGGKVWLMEALRVDLQHGMVGGGCVENQKFGGCFWYQMEQICAKTCT